MTPDLDRLRETVRWIAWVRLAAVPFAIVEVGLLSPDYPPGYEGWASATTGLLAVAGVGFFLLSRWSARRRSSPAARAGPWARHCSTSSFAPAKRLPRGHDRGALLRGARGRRARPPLQDRRAEALPAGLTRDGSRSPTAGRASPPTSSACSSRSSDAATRPALRAPGTGLGLYIARSIVEAHGGVLEVSSGADAGATFTLSLPVDSAR